MYPQTEEKEFVKIFPLQDENIIMVSWMGACTSTEYRTAMEKALDMARSKNLQNWISDTTYGAAVDPEDYQWVMTDFVPRALSVVHKVAVVISQDIFRKMETENIEQELKSKVNAVAYFDTIEKSLQWIRQ